MLSLRRAPTVAILAALAGCGGGTDIEVDGGPLPDGAAPTAARLTIASERSLALRFGQSAVFRVQYAEMDGRPIAGARVSFGLIGSVNDSSLAELSATTDVEGLVVGTLTAGGRPAAFRIRASAERSAPAHVDVSVGDLGFGGLHVVTTWPTGRIAVDRVVSLFSDATCADARVLVDSGDRTAALGPDSTEIRFVALPAELTYAVVTRAIGVTGVLVAHGCVDGTILVPDADTRVVVDAVNEPLTPDGVFATEVRVFAPATTEQVALTATAASGEFVAAGGGEGALLLQALDAELRARGFVTAADRLAAERVSRGLDADLEARLATDGVGIEPSVAAVATELAARMAEVLISGSVRVDTTLPTTDRFWFTVTGVATSGVAPGDVPLTVALAAFTTPPTADLIATVVSGADLLTVVSLDVQLPLGGLARGALASLAAEGRGATLEELLSPQAGCASFQAWAATRALVTPTECDAACFDVACGDVLSAMVMSLDAAILALDAGHARLFLSGSVTLADETGDLRVDSMRGPGLAGGWVSFDGARSDAIVARIAASRTIE